MYLPIAQRLSSHPAWGPLLMMLHPQPWLFSVLDSRLDEPLACFPSWELLSSSQSKECTAPATRTGIAFKCLQRRLKQSLDSLDHLIT